MPWLFLILLDMGVIQQYIAQLESASDQLEIVAIRAVADNEKLILSILKDEQLGEGLDSFGNVVGTYKPVTIEKWVPKDPPRTKKSVGQPYNFDWHGTFKDTMTIETDKEGYTVNSVSKRALEAIYDTKLTKLTKEHSERINKEVIEPALYKHIFESISIL